MNRQRTIKSEIKIGGIGLHTGERVNVTLHPAAENKGIVFRRTDLPNRPVVEATPSNILETNRRLQRTSIKKNGAEVHTIEHLLAALSGFSIDNVLVDIDGMELPGLDGGIKSLVELLEKTGSSQQDAPKKFIEIKKPVSCQKGDSFVKAVPDSKFRIDYSLEFEQPWLKNQSFSVSIDSSREFSRFFCDELAPSRTFCLEQEAAALLKSGLGKGANFENTLVMGRNGPINNQLRFPNELVRHKILDLLGDLYLLGGHIKGHIMAKKSGHELNAILVKEIALSARPAEGWPASGGSCKL